MITILASSLVNFQVPGKDQITAIVSFILCTFFLFGHSTDDMCTDYLCKMCRFSNCSET